MYKNKKIIFGTLLLLSSTLYGGNDIEKVTTPVAPINESPEWNISYTPYIGIGAGRGSLSDSISKEKFSSDFSSAIVGVKIGKNFAIEGRYFKNFGKMKYNQGLTGNPSSSDFQADISDISFFTKGIYPIENFLPYVMVGYGQVELDAVLTYYGRVKRTDYDFQYGVGLGYKINENIEIFYDYLILHDNKGIDGRATDAVIDAGTYTFGFTYNF